MRPQPPTRPPIELCSPYRCTYVYRKRCTNIGVYLFVSFLFLLCSVLLYWVSPHLIIVNPWKFDHFSCFLRPLLRKFRAKRGGGFISGLHQHGGFKVSQNTGWRIHHPVLNRDYYIERGDPRTSRFKNVSDGRKGYGLFYVELCCFPSNQSRRPLVFYKNVRHTPSLILTRASTRPLRGVTP